MVASALRQDAAVLVESQERVLLLKRCHCPPAHEAGVSALWGLRVCAVALSVIVLLAPKIPVSWWSSRSLLGLVWRYVLSPRPWTFFSAGLR